MYRGGGKECCTRNMNCREHFWKSTSTVEEIQVITTLKNKSLGEDELSIVFFF